MTRDCPVGAGHDEKTGAVPFYSLVRKRLIISTLLQILGSFCAEDYL